MEGAGAGADFFRKGWNFAGRGRGTLAQLPGGWSKIEKKRGESAMGGLGRKGWRIGPWQRRLLIGLAVP